MVSRLAAIPGLAILENAPLDRYTRFAVGGPARILADASTERALAEAIGIIQETGEPHAVIGGGTNLVAPDGGFPGIVLRYTNAALDIGPGAVTVAAGAMLQDLVDSTIAAGLRGLETMTGIPGWLGGAVYGNAGAYGHSLDERVVSVRYFDGVTAREIDRAACEFHYRESIFKRRKDWIVLSVALRLDPADPPELRAIADGILKTRNQKYPPSLRCAGSIFKNLLWDRLPPSVQAGVPQHLVRDGKVPSAFFLEQAGAKGLVNGGVRVADYHANLIYNDGSGTALQIRDLIAGLKRRVRDQFGIELEEEVQFIPILL